MWQIVHKVHKHKIMCTDTDSQNKISIDYNFISCDTNNTVANAVIPQRATRPQQAGRHWTLQIGRIYRVQDNDLLRVTKITCLHSSSTDEQLQWS